MDIMLTQESVLNVLKNVKNVPVVQLMLVNVLILESINHIVIVQPDIMKLVKILLNVKLVTINVALVMVLLLTVSNVVVKKDITLQNVGVLMVTLMVALKIVNHVLSNVKLVKELLKTVLNVKKTEVPSQIVIVHLLVDTMKLKVKLIAHLVTQDVKPVLFIIHVKPVKLMLTDINHQNVHVWINSSKKKWNVKNVLSNVKLVLNITIIVQLVHVTELIMITLVSVLTVSGIL